LDGDDKPKTRFSGLLSRFSERAGCVGREVQPRSRDGPGFRDLSASRQRTPRIFGRSFMNGPAAAGWSRPNPSKLGTFKAPRFFCVHMDLPGVKIGEVAYFITHNKSNPAALWAQHIVGWAEIRTSSGGSPLLLGPVSRRTTGTSGAVRCHRRERCPLMPTFYAIC
jgi:hypothetical protein